MINTGEETQRGEDAAFSADLRGVSAKIRTVRIQSQTRSYLRNLRKMYSSSSASSRFIVFRRSRNLFVMKYERLNKLGIAQSTNNKSGCRDAR